jgi:hypothetical protein
VVTRQVPIPKAHLLLAKVVWEVSDHDLGLGGNAVLRRTALLAGAKGVGLAILAGVNSDGVLVTGSGRKSLVGGVGQRKNLAGNVGRSIGRLGRCVGSLALGVATLCLWLVFDQNGFYAL